MKSADSLSYDTDFIVQLQMIESANTEEIKDLAIQLSVKPSVPNFWILSKFIRISQINTLNPIANLIADILLKNCNIYLGATFATAHFINKFVSTQRKICEELLNNLRLPSNPQYAAHVIGLIANNDIIVERFDSLIGFSDWKVQKSLAASIARTCSDPKALLVSKLSDIPNETDYNKRRGLILLCHSLIDEEVPIQNYTDVFLPLLHEKGTCLSDNSCIYEAQLLLADLLYANPTSFHPFIEDFVGIANTQFEANNLVPVFLKSILYAFGYSMVHFLSQTVLSKALSDPLTKYRSIVDAFVPYIVFLDEKGTDIFLDQLVLHCNDSRFDVGFFEMTARAFAAAAPLIPSSFGRYMAIIEKHPKVAQFHGILRPLLEPKCPPPPQKLSSTTIVLEEDKRDVEVQVIPMRSDGGAQTDFNDEKTTTQPLSLS